MRHVIVRYKVKPEHAAENEALVRAVYEELARTQPDGLRYATYKLDDGVSFVHVARSEGDILNQVAAFQRFQEHIRERCDEPPVLTELTEIGSYR